MRFCGGVVLWLHENDTQVFEVIYISDTPEAGGIGVGGLSNSPRGVARHTIAISDLLLKKEVRGSCSAYFVRVHSHGGTWVEPSAVRVQDCRVAL